MEERREGGCTRVRDTSLSRGRSKLGSHYIYGVSSRIIQLRGSK
jgi:hypothetical protein